LKAGVKVRIIYDGVGSWSLRRSFIKNIRAAGIEIFPFMPVSLGPLANKINYRNHRKIVVVDGLVGFTGGINISDKYLSGDPVLGSWRDTHLRLEGAAVSSLNQIFINDWNFVSHQNIELPTIPSFTSGHTFVQIVASGPDQQFSSILQEYFSLITAADEYIYISTPYFIPCEAILLAMKTAALSGVEVILLLPRQSDSAVLKYGIQSYLEELLEAGVRIFLYQEGFLHSKVIVSDDAVASVGTANVDERSFENNFEVNALLYDQQVAHQLKHNFFEDLCQSKEVYLDEFRKRSKRTRVLESIARLLSPLL
ncbi:MAG: cardiolipin synthase, partial [Bacteroidota bacterium]